MLTDDLVAYWPLDEASGNCADVVGSNHLSEIGIVPSVAGIIDNAAHFGTHPNNGVLSAADSPETRFPDSPWSLTWWWQAETDDTSVPIEKQAELSVSINVERGRVIVHYGDDYLFTADGPEDFAPHFYALVYGDDALTLYVDGAELEVSEIDGTPVSYTTALRFNSSGQARGVLDEVGKWGRALDAGEVAALYNGGAGLRP